MFSAASQVKDLDNLYKLEKSFYSGTYVFSAASRVKTILEFEDKQR